MLAKHVKHTPLENVFVVEQEWVFSMHCGIVRYDGKLGKGKATSAKYRNEYICHPAPYLKLDSFQAPSPQDDIFDIWSFRNGSI